MYIYSYKSFLVDPSSFFLGGWSSTELPGLGAFFYIILDSKSRMFPATYRRFARIARTIGSSQELRGEIQVAGEGGVV